MRFSILVPCGAGYFGSHMVKRLLRDGPDVTVFDNLSTGHADAVVGTALIKGELRIASDIGTALAFRTFDFVMHFAATTTGGESFPDPAKYYLNNVVGFLNLAEAMRAAQVRRLVLSSTCSIDGPPLGD